MAFVTSLTIGTGRKVSFNYQSEEASVSVTYQLEREDADLMQLVEEKATEVEQAHRTIWRRIRDLRAEPPHAEAPAETASPDDAPLPEEPVTQPQPPEPEGVATEAAASHQKAADSSPDHGGEARPEGMQTPEAMATSPQRRAIYALVTRAQMSDEELEQRLQMRFGKSAIRDLTKRQASSLLTELQRSERERADATPTRT